MNIPSASELRSRAKEKIRGNWAVLALTIIIGNLVLGASSFTVLIAILLTGAVNYGISNISLNVSRGGKGNIDDAVSGFYCFGKCIVMGALKMLFVFLWSLLLIIPGIVASYGYSMTYFIAIDRPDLSGEECLSESKKLMRGKKWRLFCLDFSFIGWYILSIFTFGILLIWISPYVNAARAEFYESVRPTVSASNVEI